MCFRGLSQSEAELCYLNTARTLDLYGVELHHTQVLFDFKHFFFQHLFDTPVFFIILEWQEIMGNVY